MAFVFKSDKKLIICHLGDSRIVIVSKDGQIRFATEDHKATNKLEYEKIVEKGGSVIDGRTHGIVSVSRSLGDLAIDELIRD